MTSLDELRTLRAKRDKVDAEYRQAIAKARDDGHSLRAVAEAAGVTHQTVVNIVAALERD